MKVRFSPIVAEARGAAGPVVASSWKGNPYFRSRVTPANPKTVAQVAQRGLLAAVVVAWQSVAAELRTFLNSLASGKGYSGFNLFTKTTVKAQTGNAATFFVPAGQGETPLEGVAAVTGLAQGGITLTWTDPELAVARDLKVYGGVIAQAGAFPAALELIDTGGVKTDAETVELTGLTANTRYRLFVGYAGDGGSLVSFPTFRDTEAVSHA